MRRFPLDGPLTTDQMLLYEKIERSGFTGRFMNVVKCVRLSQTIDIERFERAARSLVARYPILCSRLYFENGVLRQRQESRAPSIETVEVSGDEKDVDAALSRQADMPLDLFHENPFKIILARTGSDLEFMLLLGHHMFLDGISMERLLATYIDLVLNPACVDEETVRDTGERSFLSWCERQERLARDDTFSRRMGYWLGYLEDADPVIHIPDRPDDPAIQTMESIRFTLDPGAALALQNRIRRLGVTPFALTASAVFRVLSEFTGQDDITLAAVTDTRRAPFGQTVGQFASLFPFRHRLRDSELGDQEVRDIYREILKAIKYYISPMFFCGQLDWIDLRRDKKFTLAEVSVNHLPMRADLGKNTAQSGQKITPFPLTARAKPPRSPFYGSVMDFFFVPEPDGLSGILHYETAIVSSQAAERITASLCDSLSVGG